MRRATWFEALDTSAKPQGGGGEREGSVTWGWCRHKKMTPEGPGNFIRPAGPNKIAHREHILFISRYTAKIATGLKSILQDNGLVPARANGNEVHRHAHQFFQAPDVVAAVKRQVCQGAGAGNILLPAG